jgi:hypothetical protein
MTQAIKQGDYGTVNRTAVWTQDPAVDCALLELGLCVCRQGADEYARQSETAKLKQERILLLVKSA